MYTIYMELILHGITYAVLFLTTCIIVGGGLSYILDALLQKNFVVRVMDLRHEAVWDKQGNVVAKHEKCDTCTIKVVEAGGVPVSHSSME